MPLLRLSLRHGTDHQCRIEPRAEQAQAPMQMGSGDAARRANQTDALAFFDGLAGLNQ